MSTPHAFTKSGLGNAPFNLVEVARGAGSCDHCSNTRLSWLFTVESADGIRSIVGSSCVHKTGDAGLITVVDAEKKKIQAAERKAKREAQKNAERAELNLRYMELQKDCGQSDEEIREDQKRRAAPFDKQAMADYCVARAKELFADDLEKKITFIANVKKALADGGKHMIRFVAKVGGMSAYRKWYVENINYVYQYEI